LRKHIPHIILLLLIGLNSCKSYKSDLETDITEKEIYEFMEFVISDLKISDTVNIQIKPSSLFLKEPNRNYIKIDEFVLLGNEDDRFYIRRTFKPNDTTYVKNQNNRIINGFKWNKQKLGFEKNNENPMKIYFSIPYFSADKNTVLIFKRYYNTSAFMAGGWEIFKYEKTDSGWEGQSIRSALN